MESFFEWLQGLSISNWIATDESIWSFPTILFFHSVGMGLTAGVMFMICLRLVGVGRPLPVSSMRMLFRIFWWGFVMNAITNALGTEKIDMPATPSAIWAAIERLNKTRKAAE